MARKVPKQVIIESTSRCNLQCKFCPNVQNKDFPTGDMDMSLFRHVVDLIAEEMPETIAIPWMNGEPFLNPNFLEMCQYLSEKGIRFYVTTNLTMWKEDIIRYLLSDRSTCYQIIVSVDGLPDSKSIELARPGTDKDVLLTNLYKLMRIKGEMDSQKNLAFKICERGQDWQEIEEFVQYWLVEDTIDYICVGKPLKDENEESMRRSPCQYFDRNFMVIRWNGECVPCAYNDKVSNKGMLTYGRITVETPSLLDVYNNTYITDLRTRQLNGDFPKPCDQCSFAYTGMGMRGSVAFRNDPDESYFYQQDYYNMFFSKKRDWKPDSYYDQED